MDFSPSLSVNKRTQRLQKVAVHLLLQQTIGPQSSSGFKMNSCMSHCVEQKIDRPWVNLILTIIIFSQKVSLAKA